MRGGAGVIRLAMAFAVLLFALSMVVYRQSRALVALRSLDRVRTTLAVVEAERAEQQQRIQRLESRGRIVTVAGTRMGMRVPAGNEIVILPEAGTR